MELSQTEIDALISLLEDQDPFVSNHVNDKLLSLGESVIPNLETAWETSFDGVQQQRIENLIHQIQFENLLEEIKLWAKNNSDDLLRGAILIAKYQYPDLDPQALINKVEAIKRDAWLEMHYKLTPQEKVKILNHVFYRVHQFRGNTKNYHDPQNSFINVVLESSKGNQISLAIIYAVIAQKLDLPIYGVNLPQHFILCYLEEEEKNPQPQFYINAFNKGSVFNKRDIDYFLKQLKLEPKANYYLPCNNLEIIRRVVRNLISSYEKLGSMDKVADLEQIQALLT
jgi:regulator of sirC expression with transglutaminase-like and TPR domain